MDNTGSLSARYDGYNDEPVIEVANLSHGQIMVVIDRLLEKVGKESGLDLDHLLMNLWIGRNIPEDEFRDRLAYGEVNN